MRKPTALSPSALARFEDRREEFYRIYCSPVKTPRNPQVNYMAVGSAVDAYVKSSIHSAVYGDASTKGTPFEFQTLFEKQVEPHIRDDVLETSTILWEIYQKTGAYGNLLTDILSSPYAPEMEFKVSTEINGVPIMGYPDLRYVTKELVHVICDWKVNGSYSRHGVSPVPGYKVCLSLSKDGKVKEEVHKKYSEKVFRDVTISSNCLSDFSPDWATQLTMYAWCLGEVPGSEDYVIRMEQFACRPNKKDGGLNVKVATHMGQISGRFQMDVTRRLVECWRCIEIGHIFTDMTLEESLEHCELVDQRLRTPVGIHNNAAANKYLTVKEPRFK